MDKDSIITNTSMKIFGEDLNTYNNSPYLKQLQQRAEKHRRNETSESDDNNSKTPSKKSRNQVENVKRSKNKKGQNKPQTSSDLHNGQSN